MNHLLKQMGLKQGELGVTFITDKRMAVYNHQYRKKLGTTDVLSFEMNVSPFLGDILISLDTCKKQALLLKRSLRDQCLVLFVHGLLHLLGYDHQTKADFKKMALKESSLLIQSLGYNASLMAPDFADPS